MGISYEKGRGGAFLMVEGKDQLLLWKYCFGAYLTDPFNSVVSLELDLICLRLEKLKKEG